MKSNLKPFESEKSVNLGKLSISESDWQKLEQRAVRLIKIYQLWRVDQDDLLQEMILRLLQVIQKNPHLIAEQLLPIAFGVLRNMCREFKRKHRKEHLFEIPAEDDKQIAAENDPVVDAEESEFWDRIRAVYQWLPPKMKDAFLLRFPGIDPTQLSTALPGSRTNENFCRAIRFLRSHMTDYLKSN